MTKTAKPVTIPEVLPVDPVSLSCPHCKAKPGKDCATISGGLAAVHVARLKAAAAMDKANSNFSQAAAREKV